MWAEMIGQEETVSFAKETYRRSLLQKRPMGGDDTARGDDGHLDTAEEETWGAGVDIHTVDTRPSLFVFLGLYPSPPRLQRRRRACRQDTTWILATVSRIDKIIRLFCKRDL